VGLPKHKDNANIATVTSQVSKFIRVLKQNNSKTYGSATGSPLAFHGSEHRIVRLTQLNIKETRKSFISVK